jgi:hypothetical protein
MATIYSLDYKVRMLENRVHKLYCYIQNNPGGGEPIFLASPAYTISQSDIDFWNQGGGGQQSLQTVTDVGNYTTNPIESNQGILGSVLGVKNNSFIGVIDGGSLTQSENYQLPPKSGTFALLDDILPESDTLNTVVQRGSYSSKPISFLPSTTTPATGSPIGAIGIHEATYSYYWGDFSQAATGLYNVSISYGALQKLTSGDYNIGIGVFAGKETTTGKGNTFIGGLTGQKNTTGNFNAMFGRQAGNENTTGYKNTYFGTYAGYNNITSNLNVLIGYKAGNQTAMGDRNLFLGSFAGQGVTGTNNLLLGIGAGNNDGAINNRLIIHNNTTLTGYGANDTQEGILGTPTQGNLANALITGAFDQRWVKLNGYLVVGASYMPNAQGDATYTKSIVAKPDGTFGWIDRADVVSSGITTLNTTGFPAIFAYRNTLDMKNSFIHIYLDLNLGDQAVENWSIIGTIPTQFRPAQNTLITGMLTYTLNGTQTKKITMYMIEPTTGNISMMEPIPGGTTGVSLTISTQYVKMN